jgi:hypothetical protein
MYGDKFLRVRKETFEILNDLETVWGLNSIDEVIKRLFEANVK